MNTENMPASDDALGDKESSPCRRALAACRSTVAHIARGASLDQTLAGVVCGIDGQHPGILTAVLLLDDRSGHLHWGAASGLPEDYRRAADGIAIDAAACLHGGEYPAEEASRIAAEDLESSGFWRGFCELALQYGLHASVAMPILSSQDRMLGILLAYTRSPGQADGGCRQTMADAAALASIAIERHINEAEIRRTRSRLLENETRMALAIEGSGTGIWDRNVVTGEIHYSTGWKAILGYKDSEIGNRIEESYTRVHPDDLAFVKEAMQAHFDQKTESYSVEHRIRCKDGGYKWISSRGKVVGRDEDGRALRMIGTTTDITTLRTLSEELRRSVDLITNLTNEVPGLVFQYRSFPDGTAFFSYVSEGIRDIYEITPEQVAADVALLRKIIHAEDFARYYASLEASAASLTPWHLEYRVVLPRQGLRWRHGSARPRRLHDASTLWHGFISDITERKRAEAELQEFATTDFLTQLPNRRCFMERMAEELARIQRKNGMLTAVLLCDLDYFKMINDSYGHAVGDQVLKHFASILREGLRKQDAVGRVGGEEFAVVLSDAGLAEARFFARRVQKQIAETPFTEGGTPLVLTVSIGITVMKAADANAQASLSRSDMALYRAKDGGRNRIEVAVE